MKSRVYICKNRDLRTKRKKIRPYRDVTKNLPTPISLKNYKNKE